MTNQQQHEITEGPSREELFDALRLRHEGRTVTLTVVGITTFKTTIASFTKKHNFTLQVTVDGIGIEDGSGNNWFLKLSDTDLKLGSRKLEGYFNTKRREGWLRPMTS